MPKEDMNINNVEGKPRQSSTMGHLADSNP